MICERCGAQNDSDATYCNQCGRKLARKKSKVALILAAVCLLVLGIGIGLLISGIGTSGEAKLMETEGRTDFPPETVEIKDVMLLADGAIAVLYSDGMVRVCGDEAFSAAVSGWSQVAQLYANDWSGLNNGGPILVGLTEDGAVLSTAGDFSGWSNVKELHVLWDGVAGVTHDGRVLVNENTEDNDRTWSMIAGLTDVDSVVPTYFNSGFLCLKTNGDAVDCSHNVAEPQVPWNNVKEVRASDHGVYVIKKDGTVDGGLLDTYIGLKGAVEIVDFEDWLFGISADGRLLTHNGGGISPNCGDLYVAEPEYEEYFPDLVDIRQFDQVKEIIPFRGLLLLNEDGTVERIGWEPWDLSDWKDVEKVYVGGSWESPCLYGIRKDGSVIKQQPDVYQGSYQGWKLKDLYTSSDGAVGLTLDGKLVGDGLYENVDFSVFDR